MSDEDSNDDLQTLKSSTAVLEHSQNVAGEGLPNALKKFVYHDQNDTAKFKKSLALQSVTNKKHTATAFAMMHGTAKFGKVVLGFPFNATRKKEYTDAFEPTMDMLKKEVLRRAHLLLQGKPDNELLEAGSTNPLTGRTKPLGTTNMRKKDFQEWLKTCKFKLNSLDKAILTYLTNRKKTLLADCFKDDAGEQGGDSNENHWE
jgi:hypothetical protein